MNCNKKWQQAITWEVDDLAFDTFYIKKISFQGTAEKSLDEENKTLTITLNDGEKGDKGDKGDNGQITTITPVDSTIIVSGTLSDITLRVSLSGLETSTWISVAKNLMGATELHHDMKDGWEYKLRYFNPEAMGGGLNRYIEIVFGYSISPMEFLLMSILDADNYRANIVVINDRILVFNENPEINKRYLLFELLEKSYFI